MQKVLTTAITLVFLFPAGGAFAAKPKWESASECFALIRLGMSETVIEDAKAVIRGDRWNADANACLVMAYYLSGRKDAAMIKLAEAADSIPKEDVDKIHEILWEYTPEFLAEKEYRDNYTLGGGDCLLRNVTALKGTGFLIIGRFYDPRVSKVVRHITAYKCPAAGDCVDIDLTCQGCALEEGEAVIRVDAYAIAEIQRLIENRPIERNVRYIEKILEMEKR